MIHRAADDALRRADDLLAEAAAAVHRDGEVDVLLEAREVFEAEWARCRLVDRLRASGAPVRLVLVGAQVIGWIEDAGADLVVIDDGQRRCAVALAGVLAIAGLAEALADEGHGRSRPDPAPGACTWAAHLRDLVGETIRIQRSDGAVLSGRVVAAAADHLEFDAGEPGSRLAIPYGAVRLIASPSRLGRTGARPRTAG